MVPYIVTSLCCVALRSLVGLSAPGNSIVTIPDEVSNMTALRILDVASNQLTTLPDSFSQLRRLQLLRMSHNTLRAIPVGLASLPKLSDLAMRGNPVAQGIDQPNATTRPEVCLLINVPYSAGATCMRSYPLRLVCVARPVQVWCPVQILVVS